MSIVKMPSYDISHIQKWKKIHAFGSEKNQICCKAIWLRRITGPVLQEGFFYYTLCPDFTLAVVTSNDHNVCCVIKQGPEQACTDYEL